MSGLFVLISIVDLREQTLISSFWNRRRENMPIWIERARDHLSILTETVWLVFDRLPALGPDDLALIDLPSLRTVLPDWASKSS